MPSKSKTKGNKFERDVVDIFNKCFATEEFARTPSSGAIMGLSNFEKNAGLADSTKRTLGSDLIVPEWFMFSVEAKHYKDKPNYSTIIKGNDSDLDLWLGEAIFDSINLKLTPLLLFKTNNKGIHVALPLHLIDRELHLSHHLVYNEFAIIGIDQFQLACHYIVTKARVRLNETLEWMNNSSYIKQVLENLEKQKKKKKPKRKNK